MYWIGLVNSKSRDDWEWLDGSRYSWQNWNGSIEPNKGAGKVAMGSNGKWIDSISTRANYICKKGTLIL